MVRPGELVGIHRELARRPKIQGLPDPSPGDRIPYFTSLPLVVVMAETPRVHVLSQRVPDGRKVRIDW